MKKIFVLSFSIIVIFTAPVYAYMFANGSGGSWPPPPPDGGSISCVSIEKLVTEGGSAFLLSHSKFQYFLYMFEQDNTSQSFAIITEACTQMGIAYTNFFQAYQITFGKPCDPEVIDALENFDYEEYMENNGCIPFIFEKVKGYLKRCRVSEWYRDISERMLYMFNELNNIKLIVLQGGSPDLPALWRLNQRYLEVSIEGQYIAEVFNKI